MLEAFFDEGSDSFGAGGEAVCPAEVVDLLEEFSGHRDDDARGFVAFRGHGADFCTGANMA